VHPTPVSAHDAGTYGAARSPSKNVQYVQNVPDGHAFISVNSVPLAATATPNVDECSIAEVTLKKLVADEFATYRK
jgi:hypothetical protein